MPYRELVRREKAMIGRFGLRFHSLIFASGMMAIGARLLQPGETFATADIYRYMRQYLSEDQWGAIFLSVGALRVIMILAAFRKDDDPAMPVVSCLLSFISICLWSLGSAFFFAVNPIGLSNVVWSMIAAAEAVTCIMLGKMIGTVRRRVLINGPDSAHS